jgi:hypothetical protein
MEEFSMALAILPLDQFLELEQNEQVEHLIRWKMDHTLKDIRDAWGFKHTAQYYVLLKKLKIYERVVNKSDKFYPDQMLASRKEGGSQFGYSPIQQPAAQKERSDHFAYQLNTKLEGAELADKLERIAHFLKGENKSVRVKLSIEAVESVNPADSETELSVD